MKSLIPVRAEPRQLYRLTSDNLVPEKNMGQYVNEHPYEFICPGCRESRHQIDGADFQCITGETPQPLAFGHQVRYGLPAGANEKMLHCSNCDCSYTIHLGYAEPNNGRDVFPLHGVYQLRAADDLRCWQVHHSLSTGDSTGIDCQYQNWLGSFIMDVAWHERMDLTLELISTAPRSVADASGRPRPHIDSPQPRPIHPNRRPIRPKPLPEVGDSSVWLPTRAYL